MPGSAGEHRGSQNLPRWRSHAKDFSRRPQLVKQITYLAIVLAFILPLFYFSHIRAGVSETSILTEPSPEEQSSPLALDVHNVIPPHGHGSPGHHVNRPVIPAPSPIQEGTQLSSASPPTSLQAAPDIPTFAFIMWEEDSAKEGALLIKSILMYASTPVHIHIICDEPARLAIEARLKRLKHPYYDVAVFFYQMAFDDIRNRLEREGRIRTAHTAGTAGLLKLFMHEILPETVKKAIYVDTDAFFISDPLLLWRLFDNFKPETAISMPTHPNLGEPKWYNADRICSCVILLDLEKLRNMRLIDSQIYREANDGIPALSPPAFRAMFGEPDPVTQHYENILLGDQSYWWAIISYNTSIFEHLSYDWEITSCLINTYNIGLGDDMTTEEEETKSLQHTEGTPHQGKLVIPKLLHFNCIPTDLYYEWPGWSDPSEQLNQHWGLAVKYHLNYKWIWLNRATDREHNTQANLTIHRVEPVLFADELYRDKHRIQ